MAGFTSYAAILATLRGGPTQQPAYQKPLVSLAANSFSSFWNISGGTPGPGSFGTALTARQVDSSFAGAIHLDNAAAGKQLHLATARMTCALDGTFVLVDRLLEAPFNGTVTSGTFNSGIPLAIPARDANGAALGAECMMFIENVQAQTAAASITITVTYTNSAGTTGQTTGAQNVLSQTSPHGLLHHTNGLWMPLAAGDSGVRAIETYTLSASVTSTQLNIVICRPLLYLPVGTATYSERDTIVQTANLPRIFDNSALQWLKCTGVGNTGLTLGSLTLIEN